MIISRTARDPKIDKAEQESAIICLLEEAGREAEEPAEGLTAQSPSSTRVGRLVRGELHLVGPLGASVESAEPKHHLKSLELGCHLHKHSAPQENSSEHFLRVCF